MGQNLVSVIMPTFNRGHIIGRAVQSVLGQTYGDWELIVVDDASVDSTEEVIRSFHSPKIVYIRNAENKGANYSRNRGCSLAKGDYLAFLDSDNVWDRTKLERQVGSLRGCGDGTALSFCRMRAVDGTEEQVVPKDGFCIQDLEKNLKRENVIDMNTALLKKAVFQKVGGFDEGMPRFQEWELFFRIIVIYKYQADYIPEVLDYNEVQPDSISRDKGKWLEAWCMMLEKFGDVLGNEGKLFFFRTLISEAGSQAEQYAERFVNGRDFFSPALAALMAKEYCAEIRYHCTLLAWKEAMEKREGRTIFSVDLIKDAHAIALYGLGRWGELIYQEMHNCGLEIALGVDKARKSFHGIKVVPPDGIPGYVDVVVVSVFQHYDEIREELSEYYKGRIISVEEIIQATS